MTPIFGIVMGVGGMRPTLGRTLDSIKQQELTSEDQAIVCLDSFEQGSRPDIRTQVEDYGFQYVEYNAGYHFYGVEQCNYATRLLPPSCTHVMSMGDDDVLVDGTFAALRKVAGTHPDHVIISRELLNGYGLIWEVPNMRRCHVSGQCMLSPLEFVGFQDTRLDCTVDFDWMMAAIACSGNPPIFLDFVSTIAHTDGRKTGIWRCDACGGFGFKEDAQVMEMCCGQLVNKRPVPRIVDEVAA